MAVSCDGKKSCKGPLLFLGGRQSALTSIQLQFVAFGHYGKILRDVVTVEMVMQMFIIIKM